MKHRNFENGRIGITYLIALCSFMALGLLLVVSRDTSADGYDLPPRENPATTTPTAHPATPHAAEAAAGAAHLGHALLPELLQLLARELLIPVSVRLHHALAGLFRDLATSELPVIIRVPAFEGVHHALPTARRTAARAAEARMLNFESPFGALESTRIRELHLRTYRPIMACSG